MFEGFNLTQLKSLLSHCDEHFLLNILSVDVLYILMLSYIIFIIPIFSSFYAYV